MNPELATLIERIGVPVAVLGAAGWLFVKVIWPFFTKQVEAMHETLRDQISKAEKRAENIEREFLEAIERRDAINAKHVETLRDLTDEIRGWRREKG